MKDLEVGTLGYVIIGEFVIDLKKKFGRRDDETIRVVELKKVE